MVDVKVKNMIKYLLQRLIVITLAVYIFFRLFVKDGDLFRGFGMIFALIILWRIGLSVYRKLILPGKKPLDYGKWCIITGTTSGIGKAFAEGIGKEGMSMLLISRDEKKLMEQTDELKSMYKNIDVKYLTYDFTNKDGSIKDIFYAELDKLCAQMDADGGLGLLINNVGIANEIPKVLEEFSNQDIENMINCNIFSTVNMTTTVMKYMKARRNGCILSVSSGSCNAPGPFLAMYSATKYVSLVS